MRRPPRSPVSRGGDVPAARRHRLVLLGAAVGLAVLPAPVAGFTSLCRSSYLDPASFDTTVQCADHNNDWPAEHQYCLPENWGLQCGSCLQTCYSVEVEGGQPFLPFQYTFPTVELFAATCDRKTVGSKYANESSLGIYCCKPCKLWRLVTERCGVIHHEARTGSDQSCFLENADAQQGLPILRVQSSLDNSKDVPHWLFIPSTPNRGIEDTRTNFSLFQQAWRLALDPAAHLAPITPRDDDKEKRSSPIPFDNGVIPGRMGQTNVALGLNQANQRSQHQAHIHYAALPTSFRDHILTQARIPPATDPATAPCTVASGLRFGEESVAYFGWFFPWDLADAPQQWDFRSLALKQCPPLVATFAKDAAGRLMRTPPPLPFSNGSALPLPDPDDFFMSQVAIIIAPGFALDPATGRPQGHYVLLGSSATNFHAETLICTQYGIDKGGWDGAKDCPPTADGWPAPIDPATATAAAAAAPPGRRLVTEMVVEVAAGEPERPQQHPLLFLGGRHPHDDGALWASPAWRLRKGPPAAAWEALGHQ